jgi:hypothetical protein
MVAPRHKNSLGTIQTSDLTSQHVRSQHARSNRPEARSRTLRVRARSFPPFPPMRAPARLAIPPAHRAASSLRSPQSWSATTLAVVESDYFRLQWSRQQRLSRRRRRAGRQRLRHSHAIVMFEREREKETRECHASVRAE